MWADRQGVDRRRTGILAPGWVVLGWRFEDRPDGGGVLGDVVGPASDDGRLYAQIDWRVTEGGLAGYRFSVEIERPRGVPAFAEKARPAP